MRHGTGEAPAEHREAGYLLLRGGGGLWAAAREAVQAVEQHPGGVSLRLVDGGELSADQVLGVVRGLGVRALGEVVRCCWGEPARGLALHGGEPCVVIDTARPPRALQPQRPLSQSAALGEGD